MSNGIPNERLPWVKATFETFDRDQDGVIKGEEVVKDENKRAELEQGSIYDIEEGMNIKSFYKKNEKHFNTLDSIFNKLQECHEQIMRQQEQRRRQQKPRMGFLKL